MFQLYLNTTKTTCICHDTVTKAGRSNPRPKGAKLGLGTLSNWQKPNKTLAKPQLWQKLSWKKSCHVLYLGARQNILEIISEGLVKQQGI